MRSVWQRHRRVAYVVSRRLIVAAVTPEGEVLVLDPAKAGHGREVRLGQASVIDNLLQWLDGGRR